MATETTKLTFVEGAAASTPAAGRGVIYFKADGLLYSKDDAGVETLCSAGAGGMTNPLTTTGDIIYSSSGTTPARLAIGAATTFLRGGTTPSWVTPPGTELDYVAITSDVSLTGTNEATADTVITGTSQAYAAVPTLIEFSSIEAQAHPSTGAAIIVLLYDGATLIGRFGVAITPAAGAFRTPLRLAYRLTPTAATHQYIVKAYQTGSGGSPYIGAGAGGTGTSLPAFLRITKV